MTNRQATWYRRIGRKTRDASGRSVENAMPRSTMAGGVPSAVVETVPQIVVSWGANPIFHPSIQTAVKAGAQCRKADGAVVKKRRKFELSCSVGCLML
jgi:hypothetical protein